MTFNYSVKILNNLVGLSHGCMRSQFQNCNHLKRDLYLFTVYAFKFVVVLYWLIK